MPRSGLAGRGGRCCRGSRGSTWSRRLPSRRSGRRCAAQAVEIGSIGGQRCGEGPALFAHLGEERPGWLAGPAGRGWGAARYSIIDILVAGGREHLLGQREVVGGRRLVLPQAQQVAKLVADRVELAMGAP